MDALTHGAVWREMHGSQAVDRIERYANPELRPGELNPNVLRSLCRIAQLDADFGRLAGPNRVRFDGDLTLRVDRIRESVKRHRRAEDRAEAAKQMFARKCLNVDDWLSIRRHILRRRHRQRHRSHATRRHIRQHIRRQLQPPTLQMRHQPKCDRDRLVGRVAHREDPRVGRQRLQVCDVEIELADLLLLALLHQRHLDIPVPGLGRHPHETPSCCTTGRHENSRHADRHKGHADTKF